MRKLITNLKNLLINWALFATSPLYVVPYFLYERYVKKTILVPPTPVIFLAPVIIMPAVAYRLFEMGDLADIMFYGEKCLMDVKF